MKNSMKENIGLWIDHERAVIVQVSEAGEEIKVILNADDQPRRIDGVRPSGSSEAQLLAAHDVNERRFKEDLNRFYLEIIACVCEADAVLIFGPGEAKGQLQLRLEDVMPGKWVVTVETTGKMTDKQIITKVRESFRKESPAMVLRS